MKKYILLYTIASFFIAISCIAQPSITSFLPTSGPIGTTVTINGTNFNTTPANNIVFFGATKATVSAANTTTLTVSVPLGATYQPISVTNLTSNLTAYSSQPFIITSSCPNNISTSSLAPKIDSTTGINPASVSFGDFDGDGKPDMAIPNKSDNTLSIFPNNYNNGAISFAQKINLNTSIGPAYVGITDLDGDGKLDLVVPNSGANTVSVFLNTSSIGNISFASKIDFTTGANPQNNIAINDFDGDGKPDLVIVNSYNGTGGNSVSILKNTSTIGIISFDPKIDFITGIGPIGVNVSDFNADGKSDIVVVNYFSNTISLFKNNSTVGTISFDPKLDFATAVHPTFVAIGDIDGDDMPDVVTTNFSANSISIFKNTSTSSVISFASKLDFATGSGPYCVAIDDLDGDGKIDLSVTNFSSASLSLFKNNSVIGAISFAMKIDFTTGNAPIYVSIADLDSDNKPDLAIANFNAKKVSLFRNTIGALFMTNPNTSTVCSGNNLIIPLTSNTSSTYTWIASDNPNTIGESLTTQTTDTIRNSLTNVASSVQIITYTVTPTSTIPGCSAGTPQTITVSVNPNQNIITNANNKTINNGDNVNIALTSSAVSSAYIWLATDNSNTTGESSMPQSTDTINDIIINNTTSAQTVTYSVTPISASGCIIGATSLINVTVGPQNNLYQTSAQDVNWQGAMSAGGSGDDRSNSICTDINGNVYITGEFTSNSIVFGNITLNNSSTPNIDVFIVKYNSSGVVLWAKSAGGASADEGRSIAVDVNGNVYITGLFASPSITFDNITLTKTSGADVFIVKYNSIGNVVWAKSGNGSNGNWNEGISICCDVDENIIVAGRFNDNSITFDNFTLSNMASNNTADIFIVKYDSIGNIIWAKRKGGANNDFNSSVSTDSDGNIFLTGTFDISTTFDNTILIGTASNYDYKIYITKLNSAGNVLWSQKPGGTYSMYNSNNAHYYNSFISADINGNVYLTGSFDGYIVYGSGDTLFNTEGRGFFVAKYDSLGNNLWAKSASGISNSGSNPYAIGRGIVTDANGNVYITGDWRTIIYFGNDTLNNLNNGTDIFVVKYDGEGNKIWLKSTGDTGGSGPGVVPLGVAITATGSVYLTGYFGDGELFFDNYFIKNYDILATSSDIFVAKLEDGTSTVWPGDANHDYMVNNNDLLPIGLYYGQTGSPRTITSNLWQGYAATNWGTLQTNAEDIKYSDCNGDGVININDTLAINLNFSSAHPIVDNNFNNERALNPDIYFVTANNTYNAGDWINAEVWAGNTTTPVGDLYGIAFNINYDPSLVQPGTESLTYPINWLGTPGTNAITFSKTDAFATTAYGGITRINHSNANGFGKIADFNFQTKSNITSASVLYLTVSNYMANDANGTPVVFNTPADSISIIPLATGVVNTNTTAGFSIYPNPFNSQTNITFNEIQKNTTVKIIDVLGKEIKTINFTGKQLIIEKGEMQSGIYFVQVTDITKNVVNKRIIVQ